MTITELQSKYYAVSVTERSMGANRPRKKIVRIRFDESRRRRDYLDELAAIDRTECGLFLCKVERADFVEDRWWDLTGYREQAISDYRERIKKIRMEYGLTKSQCMDFMRVD